MLATTSSRIIRLDVVLASILVAIGLFLGFACALFPPTISFSLIALSVLLLLWVMPDLGLHPRSWVRFTFPPFFFSIFVVPVYYAIILPGVPWISIRRATLFSLVLPMCLTIAASGHSRRVIRTSFANLYVVRLGFIGLLAAMAVSTVFALSPTSSFAYNVNLTISCLLPMLATILYAEKDDLVIKILNWAIFCEAVNLCAGTVEHILRRPFLIYLLPAYMRQQIIAANPLADSIFTGYGMRGGLYRAASTFTNALTWGESSAMIMPICLHFMAHGKAVRNKGFGLLGVVMCVCSVYYSGSRGAYVGLITSTIVYSVVWSLRSCRIWPSSLIGKIGLTFYVMSASASLLVVTFVGRVHKLILGGGDTNASNAVRAIEWELAKPKILARPFWGYGGGSANSVIGYSYSGVPGTETVDGYHMNLLVDYGIPGLLFFSCIFIPTSIACLYAYYKIDDPNKSWIGAVGASLLAFIIYRTTLSQIDNLPFAFILVALALRFSWSRRDRIPSN